MSKKDKYSDAGKGDKSRISDAQKYSANWDKIFGADKYKKTKKKKKKPNIRYVWSADECKVDETGGPYKIDLNNLEEK